MQQLAAQETATSSGVGHAPPRSEWLGDARATLLLCAFVCACSSIVLASGFRHISDDDYSRVVIAESFAHAPSLDPSGTSWLPAPFWIVGSAMMAFGRSLATARVVTMIAALIAIALCFQGALARGLSRRASTATIVIAALLPWNLWLDAAMVPEAMCGALVAFAALVFQKPGWRVAAALALLVASLSRYEAWPACAVIAIYFAGCCRAHAHRFFNAACAVLAAAGPFAWIAWNAISHGSPTHFLDRVANYRQSIGAASVPLLSKVAEYPIALVRILGVMSPIVALALIGLRSPEMRRRWWGPLTVSAAILLFLIWGDVRDGAPTHHPERALVALTWILTAFSCDFLSRRGSSAWLVAVAIAATLPITAWRAIHQFPGADASEVRAAQIARGRALRDKAECVTVIPCRYEHFAFIAGFGAPERAHVVEPEGDASECPTVAIGCLGPSAP